VVTISTANLAIVKGMETTTTFTEDTAMFKIETDIEINASADKVWAALVDFDNYGNWNPFVQKLSGTLAVGEKLRAELHQKDSKPMTFKPRVVAVEDGKRFGWLGCLLVPKIMDGEHWYEIEELAPERVRFSQYERFGGILVPFLKGMLEKKTKPSFRLMNEALKRHVEAETK